MRFTCPAAWPGNILTDIIIHQTHYEKSDWSRAFNQFTIACELDFGRWTVQSNVRSTLLYASETWRTNKKLESKLRGFEGRCLRRIWKVRWQEKVCNEEIWRRTGVNNIVPEVKRRRWTWLGHVLRMKKGRHPLEALSWAPPGKRHRGRPLGTWLRTIEDEMKTAGKTWNELRWLAQDRSEWKKFVGALCSPSGAPRIEWVSVNLTW